MSEVSKEIKPVVLKVSTKSNPNKVAGSLSLNIEEGNKDISLLCIGAGAVNQAIKAVAIARGYLAPLGYNLKVIPSFTKVDIDGVEKTAIKLIADL